MSPAILPGSLWTCWRQLGYIVWICCKKGEPLQSRTVRWLPVTPNGRQFKTEEFSFNAFMSWLFPGKWNQGKQTANKAELWLKQPFTWCDCQYSGSRKVCQVRGRALQALETVLPHSPWVPVISSCPCACCSYLVKCFIEALWDFVTWL